ncbi:hypothetical protein GJ496_007058 [Pomphorhynchus laevis]|nr:hypothetical protein GJ496_007058 [Pomphorhynchus laevis]
MDYKDTVIFRKLVEIEKESEDLLTDKRQIFDLNRQRDSIRGCRKSDQSEMWTNFGGIFVKLPKCKVYEYLENDHKTLDNEISLLEKGLTQKAENLQRLENKEMLQAFKLSGIQEIDKDVSKEGFFGHTNL